MSINLQSVENLDGSHNRPTFRQRFANVFPTFRQRFANASEGDLLPHVPGTFMTDDHRSSARLTIAAYDQMADEYWAETQNRDLQSDYDLFLRHLKGSGPFELLDLGCGPGRDLRYFASLGHRVMGVDGSARFVAMARAYSGCVVLRQNFLRLRLPTERFDGVFASASLFHIPPADLHKVLASMRAALTPEGVLLTLNPRGRDEQGWLGDRFCCYYRLATWRRKLTEAGFVELAHAYRPNGLPRAQQHWVTTLWRKSA